MSSQLLASKRAWIIAACILIACAVFAFAHERERATSPAAYDRSVVTEYGVPIKVLKVVDGDTIQLINGDYVRYVGIDTPEEVDPRKPVQCFAKEAADENRNLIGTSTVILEKDVTAHDAYGRWLAFVYLPDGTFVNMQLVEGGYAFAYPFPPDISKAADFAAAEAEARTAHLGLWAACETHRTRYEREQTNTL